MNIKIIDLDTDQGNQIIDELKSRGWKQTKQYFPLAIDKGVDFDSYTLKKDGQELIFEWSNWFEWEVKGSLDVLKRLALEYSLKLENESTDT